MRRRRLFGTEIRGRLALVALAASSALIGARAVEAQEAPADVAAAFFKAVSEARWRDAARYLDLPAFDRYRRDQVVFLRNARVEPPMTVEQLLRHAPDMPRAVAEYQVAQMREHRDRYGDRVSMQFAGVTNVDSLGALASEDAAARWLQAQDYRWLFRRELRAQRERGCRIPDGAEDMLPEPPRPRIVATTTRDSTAYVIHHHPELESISADPSVDISSEEPRLLLLRKTHAGWRIQPRLGIAGSHGFGLVGTDDCPPPRSQRPPK